MDDLLIIGAGAAGLTAAVYARRAGLETTVVEKISYGGQVALTNEIENYPGIVSITGERLAQNFQRQAEDLGAKIISSDIRRVDFGTAVKRAFTRRGELTARTVIIANGVKKRKLGCEGEDAFSGRGVSYCATCDGAFYKNRTVIVVGGGSTALSDALYLSAICAKVYLVHRRAAFRGERFLETALRAKENVEFVLEAQVSKIVGDTIVSGAVISQHGAVRELQADAVFVAVGAQPQNVLFEQYVNLDAYGYFDAGEDCMTKTPGVYVAGDCRRKPLRQIVTAAADGAVAAHNAAEYINSLQVEEG